MQYLQNDSIMARPALHTPHAQESVHDNKQTV